MLTQRRQYSPQIDSQILELQATGIPRQQIAAQLQIPITKVHRLLRSRGAVLTPEQRAVNRRAGSAGRVAQKNYPADLSDRVADLRRNGKTIEEIAIETGVPECKIMVELRRLGILLTPKQRSEIQRRSYNGGAQLLEMQKRANTPEVYERRRRSKNALIRKTFPQYFRYKRQMLKLGKVFELSEDEFDALVFNACVYCGASGPNGIDRQDSTRGYLSGNCVSCCKHCNYSKGNMPLADFVTWLDRIAAFRAALLKPQS